MNIGKVKGILKQNDVLVKKQFGQNFLIDDNILRIIAESLKDRNERAVIEVGPGLGSLTEYLLKIYDKVLAFEIDQDMVNILKQMNNDKLIIRNIDFLKINIDEEIKNNLESLECVLISNLPYYITTPIILKILEESTLVTAMTIMVQKEVGERLLGHVSTKEYNSLSVLIQTYMNCERIINVSPHSFFPEPNVDSVVIKLVKKDKLDYNIDNEESFKKINRLLFRLRRKTIVNNLKGYYEKDKIIKMLTDLNISLTSRSEELSIKQIIDIANYLERNE